MKIVSAVSFCLLVSLGQAATEKTEFEAKGIRTLIVENSSGDVDISVSPSERITVTVSKVIFKPSDCVFTAEKVKNSLVIKAKRQSWTGASACRVDLQISVPKEMTIDVKSGSGDVNVIGTKGSLDFDLGSGDAKIQGEIVKLKGRLGNGSMDIAGVLQDAWLQTGIGNIALSYEQMPSKGELRIDTGMGDATVYVPSSTKLSTHFVAGSGHLFNELGESTGAAYEVFMKTGRGDLKIKKQK